MDSTNTRVDDKTREHRVARVLDLTAVCTYILGGDEA